MNWRRLTSLSLTATFVRALDETEQMGGEEDSQRLAHDGDNNVFLSFFLSFFLSPVRLSPS